MNPRVLHDMMLTCDEAGRPVTIARGTFDREVYLCKERHCRHLAGGDPNEMCVSLHWVCWPGDWTPWVLPACFSVLPHPPMLSSLFF